MTPTRPTLTKPPLDADKLLQLLEQWTRADVMSRLGGLDNDVCYAHVKIEKEDEIRVLLYGTCSLVELADRWGMR